MQGVWNGGKKPDRIFLVRAQWRRRRPPQITRPLETDVKQNTNMKNNVNFLIMLCLSLLVLQYGCEKTELQKASSTDAIKITNRTVDGCEDCNVDCCCTIQLWEPSDEADIDVCGFTSSDEFSCGQYDPPGSCAEFSGHGENIILSDPSNPRVYICKEPNGVFRIFNNDASSVTLRISCQADEITNPDYVILTIPANSAVFYSTDGSCVLTECE